ncbi:MAG TPA: choline/ethanolamine kinase family protein [Actinomycetota bacterium]|nr:choline/ethanolamine kinase family protein [Actinomycetota bacterium]
MIDEIVERVSLWRGLDVSVSTLSGGLTNENFLVEAGGKRYVVRVPGASTELLAVDRVNERHNAQAASTTGVAPKVLEVLADLDVMVIEYVPGETMSGERLRSPGMARRIAGSLRRLHTAPRFLHDFDMFRTLEYYLRICEEEEVRIPDGYLAHMAQVAELERAFAVHPFTKVPCHNDLLAENYIDDGTQLWIVDFEYSGNNDPTFELGDTVQECAFDAELRAVLCEAYFGEATPALLARMNLQALMADVGWTLWAAIQAKISSIDYDFWGWAVERWDRALAVLDGPDFSRWVGEVVA